MREITFIFQEAPKISINGHAFELRQSDADIFDRSLELSEKYHKLNRDSAPKTILTALKECAAVVDSILGEGATATLSEGKPVCITDMLQLMAVVTREAGASYAERLADYDE